MPLFVLKKKRNTSPWVRPHFNEAIFLITFFSNTSFNRDWTNLPKAVDTDDKGFLFLWMVLTNFFFIVFTNGGRQEVSCCFSKTGRTWFKIWGGLATEVGPASCWLSDVNGVGGDCVVWRRRWWWRVGLFFFFGLALFFFRCRFFFSWMAWSFFFVWPLSLGVSERKKIDYTGANPQT